MTENCSNDIIASKTGCKPIKGSFTRLNITKAAAEQLRDMMDKGMDINLALQDCIRNGTAYFE